MKPKRLEIIKCPVCEYEYLPSEIFVPNHFLGKVSFVDRDVSGRILDYNGTEVDLTETYTCDNCNSIFDITARVQYAVELNKLENFDEDYSTELK